MGFITITTTEKRIDVEFSDLAQYSKINKCSYKRSGLVAVFLNDEYKWVSVTVIGERPITLDCNMVNGLKVESVDGVAITSNEQLFDILKLLIN